MAAHSMSPYCATETDVPIMLESQPEYIFTCRHAAVSSSHFVVCNKKQEALLTGSWIRAESCELIMIITGPLLSTTDTYSKKAVA